MRLISRLFDFPHPIRLAVRHKLRSRLRGFSREHYFNCVRRATEEAVALGHKRMTVIEFGVASGKGLLELEQICTWLEARYPIGYDVVGFDTGTGLPKPTDIRDIPWKWAEGWYDMDAENLRRRLSRAKLVLGDVADTVPDFMNNGLAAPIGAVMFDLDYYSATTHALTIFDSDDADAQLCRVYCYFDDLGSIEDIGVPSAISEFNSRNIRKKLKPNVRWQHHRDPYVLGWKIYEFHNFDHPDYTRLVRTEKPL